jgi:hypothetical protein
MDATEIVKNKNLLLTIKYRKAAKFKANSALNEKTKTLIHAEIIETADEESEAIEIFISIKEVPE